MEHGWIQAGYNFLNFFAIYVWTCWVLMHAYDFINECGVNVVNSGHRFI